MHLVDVVERDELTKAIKATLSVFSSSQVFVSIIIKKDKIHVKY